MKAGFYADELEEVTDLYKEDDDGVIHQFDMGTEFDPVYHVKSSKPVIPK